MTKTISLKGTYCSKASGHISQYWNLVCADHQDEFPRIRQCYRGTFNIILDRETPYDPIDDPKYRNMAQQRGRLLGRGYEDGNHISPRSKVTAINGKQLEAWIYRGGHKNIFMLELLSEKALAAYLSLKNEDPLVIVIEEVAEGTPDMPLPPPISPLGDCTC